MFHKHKYKAIRTEYKGMKFPSKKEANYCMGLEIAKQAGELVFYLRQVRFDLPGNTYAYIDFQEFWANGDIKFVDTKGYDTTVSKLKRKQIEDLYPVKIEVK